MPMTAARGMGIPTAFATTMNVQPAAAATAYREPTCMIAVGRPISMSRSTLPPTAAQTPMKTAGTSGMPKARALLVPKAPNIPITTASSTTIAVLSRVKSPASSMPSKAAPAAVTRYHWFCRVAGVCPSRMSRMRPPPMPIMIPMIATPSQSSRRCPWNPAANIAPCTPPRPTPRRSAHSGMVKSGSVTRPLSRTEDNRRVPTYRDEAVILRTHKLGEADRIVTMLSRRHG